MKLVVCTAALLVALAAAAPSLPKLVADDGQVKAVTELDIPKFMVCISTNDKNSH